MATRTYIALDLEMTGLEVGTDEIIEVGAVKFEGAAPIETFSSLIRPQQSLPLKITRLTGITPEALHKAPRFNDIAPDLVRFIGSCPLVGHSVGRDIEMLEAQGVRFGQPVYDTFDLSTLLLPGVSSYKLSTLAAYLNIQHPDEHRALHDAEVTQQVFVQLLKHIDSLSMHELEEVNRLLNRTDWFTVRDLFVETLRHKARHTFTQPTPTEASDHGAGVRALFDADADADTVDMSLWDEGESLFPASPRGEGERILRPTGNTDPLNLDTVSAFFSCDGPMSRVFAHYEQRAQQADMARATAQAFNTKGTMLLVEAGTGTGKSMAYLVPAVMAAVQRGERVVVSTNTINLQDQLFSKDIPDLKRMMEDSSYPPFTAALLKGRSNYLCLKRYKALRNDEAIQPEEARMLLKVHFWLPTTATGDYVELTLTERERFVWSQVNVPADTCTGHRCPDFHDCFFFKARRKAEGVHVIVVNHALLLSDLVAQYGILPTYNHVIIDEAHNLEHVATDQFSFAIDQATLLLFLDSLFQTGGSRTVSGLLAELPTHVQQSAAEPSEQEKVERIAQDMRPVVSRISESVYACFNTLRAFVDQHMESSKEYGDATERLYDVRIRLTKDIRQKPGWAMVERAWENLDLLLGDISKGLGELETVFVALEHADIANYDELLLRLQSRKRYATEVRVNTGHTIKGDEESIHWITLDHLHDTLKLHAAPLAVDTLLQQHLFTQKQTSILTSATLAINDTFDFMKSRLGLESPKELKLESPFDYECQAMIYIPNDIPEPNQRGYGQMIEDALIQLCTATEGRTLALFTANSAIKRTIHGIRDALEDQDIIVLGQGISESRRTMIERFKEWSRMVLLGTSSFWEGVDVVGDALSVLVITKLPFSVPTDPIFAARSEQFSDPFNQYAVPQSILRFKQGFGRLIRSKQDRGIAVVLDKRLLTKRYGALFLQSLPTTTVREGPLKSLPSIAKRFLSDNK